MNIPIVFFLVLKICFRFHISNSIRVNRKLVTANLNDSLHSHIKKLYEGKYFVGDKQGTKTDHI